MFGAIEPLTGRCLVEARERRTKKDLAEFMSNVAAGYPEARRIIIVWDNLNTHNAGSFYEAFAPDKARELSSRFDFHFTTKHGSWLDVAEILLNIEETGTMRFLTSLKFDKFVPLKVYMSFCNPRYIMLNHASPSLQVLCAPTSPASPA